MHVATLDQYQGCLLGLALGDALGAPYEGGPAERLLWRLIGRTAQGEMRWTDDTQMSIDVAESLIASGHLEADDLARRLARGYRWSRGYGPGAAKLLKRIARGQDWQTASRSVYRDGSFGNGGAMRSPIVALWCAGQPAVLIDAARLAARVTHAHPLGVEGAVLVAHATALALHGTAPVEWLDASARLATGEPFSRRLSLASRWLRSHAAPEPREVARQLGNGVAAAESCVTALYVAARFVESPFEDMLRFVAQGGGDVDTIGAMAGALWGAARGRAGLPAEAIAKLEQKDRLIMLASVLFAKTHDTAASAAG